MFLIFLISEECGSKNADTKKCRAKNAGAELCICNIFQKCRSRIAIKKMIPIHLKKTKNP